MAGVVAGHGRFESFAVRPFYYFDILGESWERVRESVLVASVAVGIRIVAAQGDITESA